MSAVTGERKETIKHSGWKKYPQKTGNTSRCKKCNKYHKFDNCAEKGKICRNCDKMNHFAICCTQNICEIRKQPTERYFLGSICRTKTFRKQRKLPVLKPAHGIHKSPGGTLTCKGKFWENTMHKNKTYRFKMHVICNYTDPSQFYPR